MCVVYLRADDHAGVPVVQVTESTSVPFDVLRRSKSSTDSLVGLGGGEVWLTEVLAVSAWADR